LSSLLFVVAADLLQSIINKAKDIGLLRLPIHVGYTSDFPIIRYADDTLLIMEACSLQIFALKGILSSFATSTGLKVNYSKSEIYPINISQERLSHLASTFHCKAGTLPFTYLGLPLGVSKPSVQDCLPLTHRIERRLSSTSILFNTRCHDRNPVPAAQEERKGNRAAVILGDRLPLMLIIGLLGNQSVGLVRQIISYRWKL
jgi:hypothetical protein